MKILGARNMLKVEEAAIVYCFWRNTDQCRSILTSDPRESIRQILAAVIINPIELSIWTHENGGQIDLFDSDDGGQEVIINQASDGLSITDINVVGDASPSETLWCILNQTELNFINTVYNGITEEISSIWDDCIDMAKNSRPMENWVLDSLDDSYYDDTKDIINANLEIEFKEDDAPAIMMLVSKLDE